MLRVNSHTEPLLPEDTLHYAPAPPQGHRVLRRATWWLFGAAVCTFAAVWGWRAANQLHYLWLQRQLVNYNVPDGPMRVGRNAQIENATMWPEAARIIPLPHDGWLFPLFIHQRIARNGISRLIVVEEVAVPGGFTTRLRLTAVTYRTASLSLGSRMQSGAWANLDHGPASFHGGRIDPNDDSHFTIGYETDRGDGTIDGWLMNDGSVKLEVRDGPLR
jgi:hypothetical protein